MSEIELLNTIKEKDDCIAALTSENTKLKAELNELYDKVLALYDSYINQINFK